MTTTQKELRESAIKSAIILDQVVNDPPAQDNNEYKRAYYTLLTGVRDFLGMTYKDLNDEVLKREAAK